LKRLKVETILAAEAREIFGFLAKECSSGNASLRGWPDQQSSHRRQDEPSDTVTEARPLNLSRSFSMSFHQKDPLLM
jgi:hypothetical protein